MGIYIPGMEMPKDCISCDLQNDYGWCPAKRDVVDKYSFQTCPLIHVAEHGRLIDADAVRAKCGENAVYADDVYWYMDNAPTIIPADKEGET